MGKSFNLEIVTPERSVFKGEVVSLSLYSTLGSLTILANHAPLITDLKKGPIRYTKPDGEVKTMEVEGGFLEVSANQASLLGC